MPRGPLNAVLSALCKVELDWPLMLNKSMDTSVKIVCGIPIL